MKIVYLDAATMGYASLEPIAELGEFVSYYNSSREESLERVADCDVLITNKIRVDEELLSRAANLKLICVAATGTNNIDREATTKRGIIVRNVAAYSTDSVSQMTFTHLLRLAGQAAYLDSYVKSGQYSRSKIFCEATHPSMELAGKTMGIIGMGAIGQKVATIATAFGMKVVYYSTSGTGHCKDYPCLSLEDLLAQADVVSIHAPLNEKTRALVGAKELARMKSTAFLLNVGRGGIVDEAALAEAVDAGRIAGAGLDVFDLEPLPKDSPLLSVKHPERFSFSPHNAWASSESIDRLIERTADNIKQGW